MFAASVFDHVLDTQHWHLFENLDIGFHLPFFITKYMVLMVIAALIILAIFLPLARHVKTGEAPRGIFWNFFEAILAFIRDNIAKPYIGHHDTHHGHDDEHGHKDHAHDHAHGHGTPAVAVQAAGADSHGKVEDAHYDHGIARVPAAHPTHAEVSEADRYVPFLWTMFLFILVCNLLGLVPFGGSPTGSISVTLGLAIISFFAIHGAAVAKMGFGGYMRAQIPNLDLPLPIKVFVLLLLVPIEFVSHFIKAFVLAVRLFANVFAGHMVLAVLMLFIVMVKDATAPLFWGITGVTVLGVVALSLLELFVAFLQAYIFTFLTALFLGSALNPDH